MIDFEKELENILEDDPLGVLDIKPKRANAITADERLIESFKEINDYMEQHGKELSASRNIQERRLYSRLKGLRENPEKALALKGYDSFNLLGDITIPDPPEPPEIKTIDDILEDDALGLLDGIGGSDPVETSGTEEDIFNLKNVPKVVEKPDYVAKRKPCRDFEKFEPLFKQMHSELASKKKKLRPFKSERQIKPSSFFILQGMMVYVVTMGERELGNFGNFNARLYCVFENGTESNMLLRSLAAALWKDENSKQVAALDDIEMFDEAGEIAIGDKPTGYIYILRSLSEDPNIKEIENLYKIGFSSQPVTKRIQGAAQDPTYLMADVVPITEFKTYNLNPQKLEKLLHRFFAKCCLNLDVFDENGKRYTPREWFITPLGVIETAIQLLISGEIVNYIYDSHEQEIVPK